jgi:hypothetical protein
VDDLVWTGEPAIVAGSGFSAVARHFPGHGVDRAAGLGCHICRFSCILPPQWGHFRQESESMIRANTFRGALLALGLALLAGPVAFAQAPKPGVKGYEVEWVYRVRYGFIDEWWDLFRKYQVPILDKERQLAYVLDYRIYHPQLHTDEASRWDYRVEITYRDFDGTKHEDEIAQTLFPDGARRKKDELRRWELTTNHWDLPIYQVDVTRSR